MSRRSPATALFVALVGGFLLLGHGPAAAAPELSLSPDRGAPGSTFVVTGTGFAAAEVLIHWGDESGPVLERATGPDFSVEVRVPDDAPPNSHRVMGVVREGGSTSTSSASFQVTGGSEPVETTTTTSAPVEVPVDTPPPSTRTTTPAPVASALGGGLDRADSVGGGVGGGMADTTNGGGEAGADRAGSQPGAAAASTPGAASGGDGGTTTSTAPGAGPGAPGGAAASPPPGATDPAAGAPGGTAGSRAAGPGGQGAGDASGSALAPRPTSQSSGAVRNPLLLVVGLGMVFVAGVILAVRNRQRTGTAPIEPGA